MTQSFTQHNNKHYRKKTSGTGIYTVLVFLTLSILSGDCRTDSSLTPSLEEEIGGLVLDRSFSRFGREFYQHYCVFWREVKVTSGHTITVVESVIPRSGTVLWVEINRVKVFQTFLGRRSTTTVKSDARVAVKRTVDYVTHLSYQSDSPDIASDGY